MTTIVERSSGRFVRTSVEIEEHLHKAAREKKINLTQLLRDALKEALKE